MVNGSGSISVLVSKELTTLLQALRGFDAEQRKQIRAATKGAADPIWRDEIRGRATSRLQTRALSDTARVAVSDSNVTLKSGSVGRVRGTPASLLVLPAEYGNAPTRKVSTTSRKGAGYTRRMGAVNGAPNKRGYVVNPAARESIPRLASLWVQTTVRTINETFEKGGAR
jgi:hypothetical protein